MANRNNIDESLRKPRRTKTTPFFVQRHYYSLAFVGVCGLTWALYELWPESKKLKRSLAEGKLDDHPVIRERFLQARLAVSTPAYDSLIHHYIERKEAKEDAKLQDEPQKQPCSPVGTISKYFLKANKSVEEVVEEQENTSQNSSSSNSPYKNCLSEPKFSDFNDSGSDFKENESFPIKNAPKTDFKQPKVKKKITRKKTRQVSMKKFVKNDLDVNPDHLQMALALSKSSFEAENPHETLDEPISSQEKIENLRKVLEKYGFQNGQAKSRPQRPRTKTESRKNSKTSRYRYVKPILHIRSNEERSQLINSKISQIIDKNQTNFTEKTFEKFELFSEYLKSFERNPTLLDIHNESKDTHRFYIKNWKYEHSLKNSGHLLRDWGKIAGRDISPTRSSNITGKIGNTLENFEQMNADNISNENFQKNEEKSVVLPEVKSLNIPVISQRSVSPDLFASDEEMDKISLEKSNNLQSISVIDLCESSNESHLEEPAKLINTAENCLAKMKTEGSVPSFDLTQSDSNESTGKQIDKKETSEISLKFDKTTNLERFSIDFSSSNLDLDHLNKNEEENSKNQVDNSIFGENSPKTPVFNANSQRISTSFALSTFDLTQSDNNEAESSENQMDKGKVSEISTNLSKTKNSERFSIDFGSPTLDLTNSDRIEVENNENQANNDIFSKNSVNFSKSSNSDRISINFDSPTLDSYKNKPENNENQTDNEIFRENSLNLPNTPISDTKSNRISIGFDSTNDLNVTEYINQLLNKNPDSSKANSSLNDSSKTINYSFTGISNWQLDGIAPIDNLPTSNSPQIFSRNNSAESLSSSQGSIVISDDELNYSCAYGDNFEKSPEINDEINIEIHEKPTTPKKIQFDNLPSTSNKKDFLPDDSFDVLVANSATLAINQSHKQTPNKNNKNTQNLQLDLTPHNDFLVKTDNVTPMANYDAMDSPNILRELDNFGLKPMKRQRGVQLLKFIYESTHPIVQTKDESSDDESNAAKKRKTGHKLDFSVKSNIEIVGDIVDENEELIFETKQSKRIYSCRIPLQIVWHNFVSSNPEIRENLLLFEPLQLEVLHSMIKSEGFHFNVNDLLAFLDKHCITVRLAPRIRKKKQK